MMKRCKNCGLEKELDLFEKYKHAADGHSNRCLECARKAKNEWKAKNAEHVAEWKKQYKEENRERLLADKRDEYKRHKNKYREYGKQYYQDNKEMYAESNKRSRAKLKDNPVRQIADTYRRKLNQGMRCVKSPPWFSDLFGCTREEFKVHIEKQWKPGMTWDNWGATVIGAKTWQYDHIRPIDSFDLLDPAQVDKCFHYTNVQPLWWEENAKKHNNVE